MVKVLDHARRELDEVGPVRFNIIRVIENSGVSRSSVYHHFGGRDGVIAAVEVARMTAENAAINAVLKHVVETAESREKVFEAIRSVLVAAGSPAGRNQRAHRIAVIATAQGVPLLAETMKHDQAQTDADLGEILRIAVDRGFASRMADPEGVAHVITSLFIGRGAVDILGDESADRSWVNATMEVLEFLIPPRE